MEDEAREAQLANVTGDAALDAGHGDGVTELLNLLHVLVDEHDVEDAADQLENGHVSINEAGGHRRCIVHPEASHTLLERIGEHLLEDEEGEGEEEGRAALVVIIDRQNVGELGGRVVELNE